MIVRGSVPVYWTQPGHKYKPTPIIQRGRLVNTTPPSWLMLLVVVLFAWNSIMVYVGLTDDEETKTAFEKHFEEEMNLYQQQVYMQCALLPGNQLHMVVLSYPHLIGRH